MRECEAKFCSCKLWPEIDFALVHLSLEEAAAFVRHWVLWPRSFMVFIVWWIEEFCSQHPSQVGDQVAYWDPCIDWLITYWELCIERRDCHYKTSPIGYWAKGSTIGWYKVLGFLVTACCDNSEFSGVVTLKSPGGVFALEVFPIHKQITVSNLFSAVFSYLVICLCYHVYCMLIDLINLLG